MKYLLLILFINTINSQNEISYFHNFSVLLQTDNEKAHTLCDNLISSDEIKNKALGYSGKAYLNSLKSSFKSSDSLFYRSKILFKDFSDLKTKSWILYFNALHCVRKHELEVATDLIYQSTKLNTNNDDFLLTIKLNSTKGRIYSMSNNSQKAIEISKELIKSLKTKNLLNNRIYEDQYLKELIKLSSRSTNFYLQDTIRNLKYLDTTQKYLNKAIFFNKSNDVNNYQNFLLANYADLLYYKKQYRESLKYYKKASDFFLKIKNQKKINQINFKIGECYFFLKEYHKAKKIFQSQIDNNIWEIYNSFNYGALCYYYLFKINRNEGKTKSAVIFAKKYETFLSNYNLIKQKNDKLIDSKINLNKLTLELSEYIEVNKVLEIKQKNYLYTILLLIFVSALLLMLMIVLKKRTRRNINLLNQRILVLQNKISSPKVINSNLVSEDIKELAKKIKASEKYKYFLKPNYSLNFLANKLNTNTSYLSEVINNYFRITFSYYTNQLRINYIINELKENPKLRKYTQQALAEEAGYKSINTFKANFKKLLKVTLKDYINSLN